MYCKNYLFSYTVILIISCSYYCQSESYASYENNILGFSSPDMKSVFLHNGADLMLSVHNNTEWSTDKEECACEDGRCEIVCGEWKNGACYRTKKECVCPPEFVKVNEKKCIYCDCGKGFNCTYDKNSRSDLRICSCPEGYYDYGHKCAPFCSETKPCKNGGKCVKGKCDCHRLTHGPFCEGFFRCAYECRPRLIVDCVFDQERETYGCLCKNRSLWFDYEEWVCKPCPCGEGTCTYQDFKLKCKCNPGYKEFQNQCKKCDCGPYSECEILESGKRSCKCQKGFLEREGACLLPCNCGHEDATCSLDNAGRKVCHCPEGYEDILGICEKKKVNCTCHLPTANCIETDEGFDCVCKGGYTRDHDSNPEDPCTDIDECTFRENCHKSGHQKCINFPGSYMCQCETGFEPVNREADSHNIICEEYKPSRLPTGLTIGVVVVFIALSVGFIVFLKKSGSTITNRNGSEMQVRYSR